MNNEQREALEAAFGARDHFRNTTRALLDDQPTLFQQGLNVSAAVTRALAGAPSAVQGWVLADAVSTWLAGHRSDSPLQTRLFQEKLLSDQICVILELLPVNMGLIDEVQNGRGQSPAADVPSV